MNMAALAAVGTALPLWFLIPNVGLLLIVIAVAASAAAIPMINAPYLALLATRVPDHLQGRVLQTIMTINNLIGPFGFLAGGLIFVHLGLAWSYALIAAAATAAGLNFLFAAGEGCTKELLSAVASTAPPVEVEDCRRRPWGQACPCEARN
jgi:hypothetical protein